MRERFVPPAYPRDLRKKKLQRLDQEDMSVQDYYAELQKGIIPYSQQYPEFHRLFQLAMLAKKELQGRQPTKMKTSFTPRSASMAQARTTMPSRAHSSTTTSASRPPSISSTPSTTAPRAMDPSKASILQAAKISSSTVPTERTSDIKCHRCHVGHF
jgi:hypothetical protein